MPYCLQQHILQTEIEQFGCVFERIIVLAVQNAVCHAHSAQERSAHTVRKARIVDVRKNINKQSLLIRKFEIVVVLDVERLFVNNLVMFKTVRRVGILALHKQMFGKFGLGNLGKLLQIVHRHGNIHVVVPRNKAPVTHRTEQTSGIEPVAQSVAVADAGYYLQHLQLLELRLAEIVLVILFKILIVHSSEKEILLYRFLNYAKLKK